MFLNGVISGRHKLHTYTKDAFMPAGAKDCPPAEISAETSSRLQIGSLVDGGLSIGRSLQAVGAPHYSFRGLSEDHFRFIVAHEEASFKSGGKVI